MPGILPPPHALYICTLALLNFICVSIKYSGLTGKVRPLPHGLKDSINHLVSPVFLDTGSCRQSKKISAFKPVPFPINAHLVLTRPISLRIPGIGNIKRRR